MRVVLDSNIIIFALREEREACATILKLAGFQFKAVLPRMVLTEVTERLHSLAGKDTASFARHLLLSFPWQWIDDEFIPEEFIKKYQRIGARGGDAVIAAFVEWIKADYLVTENRDFLQELHLPWNVVRAEEFLQIVQKEGKSL